MAIRKAGSAGRVHKKKPVEQQQEVKKSSQQVIKELKQDLQQATAKGVGKSSWLSEAEIGQLMQKAQAGGPEAEAALKAELKTAMESGKLYGQDLKVGDAALKALSELTGVAAGTFRTAVANRDKVADHALAEGLEKKKESIDQADVVATKNQVDQYKLEGQTGAAVSKSQFTPHFKAGKVIGEEIKNAARAHLEENNPEALAAADAVAPAVTDMVNGTVESLAKDPEAMKRVSNAISLVGQQGFAEAVKTAAPDVGKAFTQATGVQAVNPAVVGPMLENLPRLAEKIAPSIAPKMAEVSTTLAGKLGVEVGTTMAKSAAKEGAEAAAKAVAKSAVKEGAEAAGKAVAKTVAKEGAEAAAKGGAKLAATGGKAVPGLGNVISVGSACLAAVGFVKSLFANPRDGESVAKNGLNTLLQTVGIAFPWVGLAGDLVDMGWSAKKAVTDAKQGKEPEQGISKQDAAALVAEPARLLSSVLTGAGQGGAAKAFSDLASVTEKAASAKEIERHQVNAFSQLSQVASQETTKAAAQEDDPATRDALNTVAHGFGELFKVLYQHKKLKGADDTKRGDVKGQLARITGDVAMGMAALHVGGKDAKLDVLDNV